MEIGRRLGNQVGDAIAFTSPDIRGENTGAAFFVDQINPPTAWRGNILAHVNGRKVGAFPDDPFFVPAPAGQRVYLEFFLAGPGNAGEDVTRYLRSLPGDRVGLGWTRATIDQKRFRVYHTAGLTAVPDVEVADFGLEDRTSGTGSLTAAVFAFVSDRLPAGGHSFQIRPLDAAGNEKTGCGILTATLSPWPLPPTGVEVHAFNATTGLVTVKWSDPPDDTAGDRYRVFRSASTNARVAYGTAVKSATSPVAVTGTPSKSYATFALPATGAAAAGLWLVGVRHRRGSTEEDNVSALARFVVSPRGRWSGSGFPFPPSFVTVDQRPGGRLRVAVKHDNLGEPNRTRRFKIYRSPGISLYFDPAYFDPSYFLSATGSVDFSTAVGSMLRTHQRRFFEGTAGFGSLTEGLVYKFTVRSEATAGLMETNTAVAANTPDATPPTSCPAAPAIAKVIG